MAWLKSSPQLIARFEAALPADAAVEKRKMFGYPCAFVNGNMFTGLHEERLIVRLGAADRAALDAVGGKTFEPMAGRPMKDYAVVPGAIIAEPRALSGWVAKSLAHARALPAKAAKKKKAKSAKPLEATKKKTAAATKKKTAAATKKKR